MLTEVPKRRRADGMMLASYRTHVGRAERCGCNLDGPDRACNVGYSLWQAAHPVDWGNPKWQGY